MLDAMSLDQLRVFLAVCDAGSFSAAARRLRRAQSAVSHAVMTLEAALGLRLFDRGGRIPVLTAAGRTLAADARTVVGQAEEMKARARAIAADLEPELSLAVDAIFPRPVLIRALDGLRAEFPLLPVALYTEALGAVEERVLSGRCSLGISSLGNLAPAAAGLERRLLTEIPFVPVAAAMHPLARLPPPLGNAVLRRHTQLVLTDRSALTEGFRGGIVGERTWRFADLDTKLAFLVAGFGWGGMPTHMVEAEIAQGRLAALALEEWGGRPRHLPLSVVHRRGDTPGRAARWLLQRLEPELAQCPADHVGRPAALSSASAAPAASPGSRRAAVPRSPARTRS
ncbi:MAG: LysR family transcriptional regulator [Alphaproteobacteria bacterium]|nr:LysR family transcriptional regulator [Alphaproteobacteria bacterium]